MRQGPQVLDGEMDDELSDPSTWNYPMGNE